MFYFLDQLLNYFKGLKNNIIIIYTFRTKFTYLLHKSVFKSNTTLHIKSQLNKTGEWEVLI